MFCKTKPKVSEKKGQPFRVSFGKKLLVTELVLYYDHQSAGINLQSPQSDSTPWTLILLATLAARLPNIIKLFLLFFFVKLKFAPLHSVLLDFFCHSPWIHIKVFIVFFKGRSWKAEIWWFQTISWWASFVKRPILAIRPKVPIWIMQLVIIVNLDFASFIDY